MSNERPNVICISGFDPSGGAGILADIKTLEMHKVQGHGICTALTFQNEYSFSGLEWVSEDNILRQLDVLLESYQAKAIKIGIIQNLTVLQNLLERVKEKSNVPIIWDPVLKASAGFNFHEGFDKDQFFGLLELIDLLTPNLPECKQLFNSTEPEVIAETSGCAVLIKGGHSNSRLSTDVLIEKGEKQVFSHLKKTGFSKHGTGCILSSAIAANLALGKDLPQSCSLAKDYIQHILTSNNSRLAYHYEL